jgi:hypothetical protein
VLKFRKKLKHSFNQKNLNYFLLPSIYIAPVPIPAQLHTPIIAPCTFFLTYNGSGSCTNTCANYGPLAVLLQPFCCGCRGGSIIFRLTIIVSFWVSTFVISTCMESITLCFPLPLPWNQQLLSSQPLNPFFLDFYKQLKRQCYKI